MEEHSYRLRELSGGESDLLHYVFLVDSEPSGFASLRLRGADEGLIEEVYLSPVFRGRGIGRLLVRVLVHTCFEKKRFNVFAHSGLNKRLKDFYLKNGFEARGELLFLTDPENVFSGF